MSGGDRRGAERAAADWPLTIETFDGRVIAGEVVDVSTSGMRVRAATDVPVGAAVTVHVMLPGGADRLEVVARVTRRTAMDVALDFIGLPETEARRFRPLVFPWEARRRSPRVHAPVPVRVERRTDGSAPGEIVDLSAFAARVATDLPVAPGDRVSLHLSAAKPDSPLTLPAVVWAVDGHGVVLVFVNLSRAAFGRLRAYVSSLRRRES